MQQGMIKAVNAIEMMLLGDTDAAMNEYNKKPPKKKATKNEAADM